MPVQKGMKRKALIKGSYKAVCAPGSIRTKMNGPHRVLICCPKGKWMPRKQRCKVGTKGISIDSPLKGLGRSCKPFTAAALRKGTKIEKREHRLPTKFAERIARDHLCENPKFYAKER